jgi:DNA-binding winged helix-turn-helix (wHTH) protein/Tol biopolymer transport system component
MRPDSLATSDTPEEAVRLLRFGVFEMDLRSGELRKSGLLLKLPPQPFHVLARLALRRGEVVTREELQREVWQDGTVVDFDQRLNSCINQIRTTLGDDADVPRFVETLPRRGYRWIGPLDVVKAHEDAFPRAEPSADLPIPAASSGAATVPSRTWSRLHAALTVLLAAVALALVLGRPRPSEPRWSRLTFQRGGVNAARFGPGGEILYSAAWEGAPWGLYLQRPGVPDPQPVGTAAARLVGWSERGEVAFLSGDTTPSVLGRAPLAGGPAKEILTGVAAADWSRDGAEFAVSRFSPQQGRAQVEWPVGTAQGLADQPTHLRISPDGRRLAYLEHPVVGDDRGHVAVVERGGSPRKLTKEWSSVEGLAWSPTGKEIWFTASDGAGDMSIYAVDLGGRVRELLAGAGRLVLFDVADDGRVLVDRRTQRQETIFGRDGEGERHLSWLDMTSVTDLSDDGRMALLNETGSGGGQDYGVYLRPTDGSSPVRLGSGRSTALSPDGSFALSIPISARDRIEMIPTGAGETRVLRDEGIAAYEWALFFPDGRRLLFVGQDGEGSWRLYVRSLEGGDARPISPVGVKVQKFQPISPDGRFVAARCPPDYCLYPTDGGEPQVIPGMGTYRPLRWDATGRHLFVRERTFNPTITISRLEVATGGAVPWRVLHPPDPVGVVFVTGLSLSPDGKAWAYDYLRRLSELYVVEGLR